MHPRTDASASAIGEVVALVGVGGVDVVCGGKRVGEVAPGVEGVGVGEDCGVAVDCPRYVSETMQCGAVFGI